MQPMEQKNGLSIIFYPTFPSTRKRLAVYTWHTIYESKIHNRLNRKESNYSLSSSSSSQQIRQQQQQQPQQHQHQQQPQQLQLLQQQLQQFQQHHQQQLQHQELQQQQQPQLHHHQQQHQHEDYIIQEEGSGCGSYGVNNVIIIGNDGFSKVPHEIMMIIMDDLEVTDIISLSMVNRKLRAHTQDNYLWHQILLKNYGEKAIQDYSNKLLLSNIPRKGKWKCKPKQIPSTTNWQKVYMSLSTVKIKTKTAFARGRPGTFYRYRDFDTKDNEPSNNRIRQKQRSFNIEMTISNVPPGIYDIVWRMKIDKSFEKPIINFSTDIWLRHDIYLSSYEREAKYKYSPDPEELSKIFDKGWFHFRLPYRIEIPKIEHSEERRYHVHTGIYCYTEKLGNKLCKSSSSVKGPFSVDYVCLRPHIPYNHYNDLNHITAENEGDVLYDNDYDCDSVDESFSVVHNNSSSFSVVDETIDGCGGGDKKFSNKRRESIKSLIKHKKRISKLLCF